MSLGRLALHEKAYSQSPDHDYLHVVFLMVWLSIPFWGTNNREMNYVRLHNAARQVNKRP